MFVPVPGVAQVLINGVTGSGPFQHQTYWGITSGAVPYTVADLQLLADTVFNALKTNCQSIIGNWNTYSNAVALDLHDDTLRTATSAGATWNGTLVSTLISQSTCVVLSEKVNRRYRGGHPRLYLGWGGQSQSTGGTSWTPAYLTQVQNAMANVKSAVAAANFSSGLLTAPAVVPNYTYTYTDDPSHHKWKKERSGLRFVSSITAYQGRILFGNQKGRLTP